MALCPRPSTWTGDWIWNYAVWATRLRGEPVRRGRERAVCDTATARRLVGAVRNPHVSEARRRIFADRFRRAEPVVARAIDRGELPADTDPVELIKTLVAPIHFRLPVSPDPVEEGTADLAVRITLAAARAGVLAKGSPAPATATEADAGQAADEGATRAAGPQASTKRSASAGTKSS
ncbi:TetR-like C-terminal domain-containing protein [Streptomyces sp. NPDC059538]|uniref:TetR-like C-terminal domain-containing protein n=1 Tax=Streptomyces sp. NPDC059538 TaxID=3346860 RepID=UPI0036BF3350